MITNELSNYVKEFQKGRKEVFEMIYIATDKQLFSVLYSFTKDEQLTYDLMQETYITRDIIDNLSLEQKTAVYLYYFNELSLSEVAKEMQCSEGTVKSRLNYARKKIKAEVDTFNKITCSIIAGVVAVSIIAGYQITKPEKNTINEYSETIVQNMRDDQQDIKKTEDTVRDADKIQDSDLHTGERADYIQYAYIAYDELGISGAGDISSSSNLVEVNIEPKLGNIL